MENLENPLVSVVIPNYNYGRSLGLCIESALAQDYPRKEVIVVDDGSTDDSLAVARCYDVTVLSTIANCGVAAARNTGAAHATGEILFFLDSDVALCPGALRSAVELLRDDGDLGAVCGVYEAEPLIHDGLVEECRCLQAHYWRASSEGSVSFLISAMCAMRVEVFEAVGRFNPRLRQTEEVDFGQRLTQSHRLLLTRRIRGTHDDDHSLVALVHKIFTRGRLRVPLYLRRRRFAQGFETAARSWASLASLLTVLSLAVPAVSGPVGWLLPSLLFTVMIGLDIGMYRFVARRRGRAFLLPFVGVQIAFNLSVVLGVVAGMFQWTTSRRFRGLYEREYATAPAPEPAL